MGKKIRARLKAKKSDLSIEKYLGVASATGCWLERLEPGHNV